MNLTSSQRDGVVATLCLNCSITQIECLNYMLNGEFTYLYLKNWTSQCCD